MATDSRTILHCALIPGIGDSTIGKLCLVLGPGNCTQMYDWCVSDFIERASISLSHAQLLVKGLADRALLDRELELIGCHKISWVTCIDANYPAALKNIYAPPALLFWRGAAPDSFSHVIGWVGSRAANRYASAVTTKFMPELVAAGWAIASGGALGADTMAHEATLKAAGQTIAIIGAGLLRPYPATNKNLFERIEASGGCVLSPFPLEMQAMPGNFPARNRIIAGLSRAVVVVQAAEKSGARITALQALEQGREVCVVPGDIFDPLSAGCHRLLTEGATPVMSTEDILRACGYTPARVDLMSQKTIQPSADLPVDLSVDLSRDPLLGHCREARSFDELLVAIGCDSAQLQERLFNLQLDGAVIQDFLGRWTATV